MDKILNILISHYGVKDQEGFGRSFMLAKGLAKIGHSITFITSQSKKFKFPYTKEKRDSVTVISFPDIAPLKIRSMGLGPLNIILRSLFSINHRFDIVHSDSGHRPAAGFPCLVNRLIFRSKYISEWWDFFGKGGIYDDRPWWYRATLGNYDSWAEIHNKKIADGVVALSEFTKKRAKRIGIKEDKVFVLNGGADTDYILYSPHTELKKKYDIPKDHLTFCFIGMSNGEISGLEPFLCAINLVKKDMKIKLITTGGIISNEYRTKYNIGDELIQFGWVPYGEYHELLSCADVFILLQKANNKNLARWPNKLGDYLAAGRPIMANPVGEVVKMINEYPEAFYVVDWDVNSIAEAIKNISYQKDSILKRGVACRKIAEKLSWCNKSMELAEFYKYILKH